MTQYIVITGDPATGFNFHGPFDDHTEAITYAESISDDWWITSLIKP